jgi:hypothetical protein
MLNPTLPMKGGKIFLLAPRRVGLDQTVDNAYNSHHLIFQARSSGVEYLLDMQGVGGSKPPVPIFLTC